MTSDFQNKDRNLAENVISLNRHEFVTEIEQRLAKARRLFSLHDYVPCQELVLQILEVDPHNSKAKTLLELTGIKLSKRKLYEKIVDPYISQRQGSTESKLKDSASELNHAYSDLNQQPAGSEDASLQADIIQKKQTGLETASKPDSSQSDSTPSSREDPDHPEILREKTISALAKLLQQKDKSLQNWGDPRSGNNQAGRKALEGKAGEASSSFLKEELDRLPPTPIEVQQEIQPEPNDSSADSPMESCKATEEAMKLSLESAQLDPKAKTNPNSVELIQLPPSHSPAALTEASETKPDLIRLPNAQLFEGIRPLKKTDTKQLVERKLKERSEEFRESQIRTVSTAQIKKYLYREEYELCALELEKFRQLFPRNGKIQSFVENTCKRLGELQRIQGFKIQAKGLLVAAFSHYQEGRLSEALSATQEVLGIIPDHQAAVKFADFVQKRLAQETRKGMVT